MLPPDMIFVLVPNPAAGARDINLSHDEWRVLTKVNGKNTLMQISQLLELELERVAEILALLQVEGLIQPKRTDLRVPPRVPDVDNLYAVDLSGQPKQLLFETLSPNIYQSPRYRWRVELGLLERQLVDVLLTYQISMEALLRRWVNQTPPPLPAALVQHADALEQDCAQLLGAHGIVAVRLSLVKRPQGSRAGTDEGLAWAWQAPLEQLALLIISWYREQVMQLALLYGELLAQKGPLFPESPSPLDASDLPAQTAGELIDMPRLGYGQGPHKLDPQSVLQRLLDTLPSIEQRLHALIIVASSGVDDGEPLLA